jgi:hypothetical protein
MTVHKLIVLTNSVPGRDEEFNSWYSNTHLRDVVAVPGYISAQRFRLSGKLSDGPSWNYLAIYEVETEDPEGALNALKARAGTESMVISDAMDAANICAALYCEMTPVLKRSRSV